MHLQTISKTFRKIVGYLKISEFSKVDFIRLHKKFLAESGKFFIF